MEQTAHHQPTPETPQNPQNPTSRLSQEEIRSQTREYGAEMDRFGVAIGGMSSTILRFAESFERVADSFEVACTRLEGSAGMLNGRAGGGHRAAIPQGPGGGGIWSHHGRGRGHDPESWGYSGIDTARDHVEWGRLIGQLEQHAADLKGVMARSELAFSRLIQRLEIAANRIGDRISA